MPGKTWQFQVSELHSLYLEECGSPDGVPVIFLHGGPGASCVPSHRRFFDPQQYRIILFDQRGSGKSRPHASLEQNTTQDLVEDLEKIRKFLNIDQWVVFGGSWGSTLALAYAETHPERVLGLILRGIFLCRNQDIQWFYQQGCNRLFPEAWQKFQQPIDESERHDMVAAYYQHLTSANEIDRMGAAKAWSVWEGSTATLLPDKAVIGYFGNPHMALSIARIECHYFSHNSFLTDNQLLKEAEKIADIPGFIIHGRYDVICPVDQALALHDVWPTSELNIIPNAGHAVSEPGISEALIKSTNKMLELIS